MLVCSHQKQNGCNSKLLSLIEREAIMTMKATRAFIRNRYTTLYCGYCDLHYLLNLFDAEYYNEGIYGWNWNGYTFGHYCIVTGYRNLTGTRINFNLVDKYNKLGKLASSKNWSYSRVRKFKENLIYRLIRETLRK